jgi:hypothetical protein
MTGNLPLRIENLTSGCVNAQPFFSALHRTRKTPEPVGMPVRRHERGGQK